ncbi:TPA_asm: P7 [Euphorbia alphacytorhabdovirus 1]|nr:TPA_asm: P7 [Euphorbia alphacytorhabdovirus 1]
MTPASIYIVPIMLILKVTLLSFYYIRKRRSRLRKSLRLVWA